MIKYMYAFYLSLFSLAAFAQFPAELFDLPTQSPRCSAGQRIGVTSVMIDYGSPAVRGRKIWNSFTVPYDGKPFPWRAGADKNTTITFSNDVKVNGHDLAAGTYGFHVIPSAGEWTLIFSKNNDSWGSFFYKQEEDALRINVKPDSIAHQENLRYVFLDAINAPETSSAKVALQWERVSASFLVEEDTKTYTFNNIKNKLRDVNGFSWYASYLAAQYCNQTKLNLDEGLIWIEKSLRGGMNYRNLSTKAELLEKLGRNDEAVKARELALKVATPSELYASGRSLLMSGKPDEAKSLFDLNKQKYGEGLWMVTDGLARYSSSKGDYKTALKYAKLTIANHTDNDSKKFWETAIKKLEEGKDMNK